MLIFVNSVVYDCVVKQLSKSRIVVLALQGSLVVQVFQEKNLTVCKITFITRQEYKIKIQRCLSVSQKASNITVNDVLSAVTYSSWVSGFSILWTLTFQAFVALSGVLVSSA